jgi:Ni/Co efflux regulator RcnB
MEDIMVRATALVVAAAAMLGTSAVSAQVVDLGRGGPTIDLRSDRQRERDYQRREMRRDAEYGRSRYDRRDLSTGSVGCRTVTIRERDEYGNSVTRRRSDC